MSAAIIGFILIIVIAAFLAKTMNPAKSGSLRDVKPTGIVAEYIEIANRIPGSSRPDENAAGKKIAHEYVYSVQGVKKCQPGEYPQLIIPTLRLYERLALIPREDNDYEPHAVEVVTMDGCHIGWYSTGGDASDPVYCRLIDKDTIFVTVNKTGTIKTDDGPIWWCEMKLVLYATEYDPGKTRRAEKRDPTPSELAAFESVKSMLTDAACIEDIGYKTTEKYISIIYKGNSRKWICRIYDYNQTIRVSIPDADGNCTDYTLQNIDAIHDLRGYLQSTAKRISS